MKQIKDLFTKLMAKVTKQPDGCWVWHGGMHQQGYGMIKDTLAGKMRTTHRVAAELAGMDITGKQVIHTCLNLACCNPAHLATGTQKEVVGNSIKLRGAPQGALKGSHQPRIQCPHCERTMPRHNMKWHIQCKHPDK